MTRLNEYDRSHPYKATVVNNQRLTPENVPEVRNIRLHIEPPDFRYIEGQHIGIIVPVHDNFGNETHFRLYTIANSPQPDADGTIAIDLCVRRCFSVDDISGELVPGIASNFLCNTHPGDIVTFTGPYGDAFTIPKDNRSNLLMIGSGTGIAPFRAFIQHIYQNHPDWQGSLQLFYGARSGLEKLYRNDLNDDLSNYYTLEMFQAYEGLSKRPWMREDDSGITHILEQHARQIWELIQSPLTRVYIAGLKKTAREFAAIMIQTAGSEARWHWTREEMLEQRRWSELIFD